MNPKRLIDYKRLAIAVNNSRFTHNDGKMDKLSLREVAKKVGTSYNTLSRIELGNICDLETYAKICVFLKVSLDTFLVKNNNN